MASGAEANDQAGVGHAACRARAFLRKLMRTGCAVKRAGQESGAKVPGTFRQSHAAGIAISGVSAAGIGMIATVGPGYPPRVRKYAGAGGPSCNAPKNRPVG